MKISVLGTGIVGRTIGTKLVQLGHDVRMGSRAAGGPAAGEWVASAVGLDGRAGEGTFADSARHGDIAFNCTAGMASLDALRAAGAPALAGKILVDVANPLDFSGGFPPKIGFADQISLGERIQTVFPAVRVVKALNTINCALMVDPGRVPAAHDVFVCGNDAGAKTDVTKLLKDWFGWPQVIDLGDITGARATEAYLGLWIRLMQGLGTADFNIRVVRGE